MAPRITLRPATAADLELLVRHRRRMWADMGVGDEALLDAADTDYRRWARRRMRVGRLVGWVAAAAGAPVGSGCVCLYDVHPRPGFPGGDQPYLLSMYTEPAWRGKGVARRIVRAAIAWSRAGGYPRLTLHASAQGAPLYERLGFVPMREMKLELRRRAARKPSSARGSPRGKRTAAARAPTPSR